MVGDGCHPSGAIPVLGRVIDKKLNVSGKEDGPNSTKKAADISEQD